jgi:hypothetical protein
MLQNMPLHSTQLPDNAVETNKEHRAVTSSLARLIRVMMILGQSVGLIRGLRPLKYPHNYSSAFSPTPDDRSLLHFRMSTRNHRDRSFHVP